MSKINKEILEHYVKYFNNQERLLNPSTKPIGHCVVITEDRDKALSVMKERGAVIKREYYTLAGQSRKDIEWELNGETWLWKDWCESHSGYRFYKVLVDENVDEELFELIFHLSFLFCRSMEII